MKKIMLALTMICLSGAAMAEYAWDAAREGESTANQSAREAAQKASKELVNKDRNRKKQDPTLLKTIEDISEKWGKVTGSEVVRRAQYTGLLDELRRVSPGTDK